MNFKEVSRIFLHFAAFGFSFYCLSGLNLSKLMLNTPERDTKALLLLILMSLGLGYLVAQFLLSIVYVI
ncbi:MAG: DUF1146 domain-containing protein [Erysipelotrichaceae bacterium]|nr:DUF1146 domain-containing protein [Erysipelotrichaceae bacterium]